MFKDQIKAKLLEKFPGSLKKLTPKALDAIVDQLSSKVQEEGEIENLITGLESSPLPFEKYVELIVSESDRRARQTKSTIEKDFELVKKNAEPQNPDPGQPQPQQPQSDDIRKMIQDGINSALAPFKSVLTQTQLKEKFKEKGIPERLAADYDPAKEGFDLDAAVLDAETKWRDLKQVAINEEVQAGGFRQANSSADSDLNNIKEFAKDTDYKDAGYNIQSDI